MGVLPTPPTLVLISTDKQRCSRDEPWSAPSSHSGTVPLPAARSPVPQRDPLLALVPGLGWCVERATSRLGGA